MTTNNYEADMIIIHVGTLNDFIFLTYVRRPLFPTENLINQYLEDCTYYTKTRDLSHTEVFSNSVVTDQQLVSLVVD